MRDTISGATKKIHETTRKIVELLDFPKVSQHIGAFFGALPRPSRLLALPATLLLAGCDDYSIMNSAGQIGAEQSWLIVFATCLMLVVVLPVIAMALFFAWKYRESNKASEADYAPEWEHSTAIEVVVWLVPCLIIAVLAVVTWKTSHSLDPYKPIASEKKPVVIDVVSLDWKWLFIYPEYGIATVNEVRFPEGTPLEFHLTSGSVMNSFFIPRLGGQIYTMTGMETRLHLIADETGVFRGMSANYSGSGFSHMTFKAQAMKQTAFEAWVDDVKQSPKDLTLTAYSKLEQPSEDDEVSYYASVAPNLFDGILHKLFVSDGYACIPPNTTLQTAAKE